LRYPVRIIRGPPFPVVGDVTPGQNPQACSPSGHFDRLPLPSYNKHEVGDIGQTSVNNFI